MKKILLILSLATAYFATYAQNTFPSSGSVGIGTTSPGENFDVTGSGGAFSATAKANAIFEQDHVNYRGVTLGYDASGQIGIIAGNSPSTSAPSSLAFWTVNNAGWAENMRLTSVGNLGISTTSPTAKLQVGAGTSNNGSSIAILSGVSAGGRVNALSLVNSATAATANEVDITFHIAGNYVPTAQIGAIAESSQPTTDLVFSTYTSSTLTEKMRILGNGNMIIGRATQNNSNYLLDVYGTARANSIVVNATGADFVFDPSYKLNTLRALKGYIDKNHHLPEIASAAEMQKDGLNVGENQVKLLQKVEELTLYLIEKDKQLNEQAEATKALQQKIEQLTKQMQLLMEATNKTKFKN